MFVMLKRDWPGNFRRSVRDPETNEILRQYEFAPGEPAEVPPEDEAAIRADIGKALVEVNANGKPIKRVGEVQGDPDIAVRLRRAENDLEAAVNRIDELEELLSGERRQNSDLTTLVEELRATIAATAAAPAPSLPLPAAEVSAPGTVEDGVPAADQTLTVSEPAPVEPPKPAPKPQYQHVKKR